ncbi:hypothetical protein E4U51_008134 [Claviceps purpurea]|nr:hypothetical protein E4U51_008134 [Claviceps purpurea]
MSRSKQPRPDIIATPRRSKRRRDRLKSDSSDEEQQGPSRKTPRKASQRPKRGTIDGQNESLRENMGSKELAEPYLLTIAKIPLKALDTT